MIWYENVCLNADLVLLTIGLKCLKKYATGIFEFKDLNTVVDGTLMKHIPGATAPFILDPTSIPQPRGSCLGD